LVTKATKATNKEERTVKPAALLQLTFKEPASKKVGTAAKHATPLKVLV